MEKGGGVRTLQTLPWIGHCSGHCLWDGFGRSGTGVKRFCSVNFLLVLCWQQQKKKKKKEKKGTKRNGFDFLNMSILPKNGKSDDENCCHAQGYQYIGKEIWFDISVDGSWYSCSSSDLGCQGDRWLYHRCDGLIPCNFFHGHNLSLEVLLQGGFVFQDNFLKNTRG